MLSVCLSPRAGHTSRPPRTAPCVFSCLSPHGSSTTFPSEQQLDLNQLEEDRLCLQFDLPRQHTLGSGQLNYLSLQTFRHLASWVGPSSTVASLFRTVSKTTQGKQSQPGTHTHFTWRLRLGGATASEGPGAVRRAWFLGCVSTWRSDSSSQGRETRPCAGRRAGSSAEHKAPERSLPRSAFVGHP